MTNYMDPCMIHIKSFNNKSNPSDVIEHNKYSLNQQHLLIGSKQQEPGYVKIPVTVFYVLLFLFGVFANGSSILTLLKNGRMKISAIRFYLLSLALADLLLLLTIPVTVYRYYWQYYPWVLSNPVCKLYFMVRQIYCATTSWTIIAFTAERYIAICHPMWSITSLRQSRMVYLLAVIWVFSAISAVPFAIVYGQSAACILDYTATSQDKAVFYSTVCEMTEQEPFTLYKTMVQMRSILCFLVPLTTIIIFHLLIFRHLSVNSRQREEMGLTYPWRGQCSNPFTSSGNLPGTERKALQLMGAVIIAFFICNFPDTAATLMHIYTENWTASVYTIYTWLKSYLSLPLWYVNSALDPILFCISSSSFRTAGKETLAPLIPQFNQSRNGHKLHVSCISLSQNWARNQLTVSPLTCKSSLTLNSCSGELPDSFDVQQRRGLELLSLRGFLEQCHQQTSQGNLRPIEPLSESLGSAEPLRLETLRPVDSRPWEILTSKT
ncbi:neurotensin receptor type 1-like [Stegostoma tigrinum]|uniref:neurotensin receptor type 1-like n=1 Tax=Stegostoma tigrinum TaxID=3053191 RepID=UPI00286FBA59|nr:neurotensin receptor type 1-like [Stegostoma tigrinum]